MGVSCEYVEYTDTFTCSRTARGEPCAGDVKTAFHGGVIDNWHAYPAGVSLSPPTAVPVLGCVQCFDTVLVCADCPHRRADFFASLRTLVHTCCTFLSSLQSMGFHFRAIIVAWNVCPFLLSNAYLFPSSPCLFSSPGNRQQGGSCPNTACTVQGVWDTLGPPKNCLRRLQRLRFWQLSKGSVPGVISVYFARNIRSVHAPCDSALQDFKPRSMGLVVDAMDFCQGGPTFWQRGHTVLALYLQFTPLSGSRSLVGVCHKGGTSMPVGISGCAYTFAFKGGILHA